MAIDDSRENKARRKIAEANATLADLQRDRLTTLMAKCLPAYDDLRADQGSTGTIRRFELSAALLKFLAGAVDPGDFTGRDSAQQLERAVESFSRQLRLHRKRVERDFDVFLSYNSNDRPQVGTVAGYFEAAGLLPWFDQNELGPGDTWQATLQRDIESIKTCAVIVGASGIGPWQDLEIQGALQLFVERNRRIIPVLLPNCGVAPELPLFLRSFGWIDFRVLSPDPIAQMIRALSRDADA